MSVFDILLLSMIKGDKMTTKTKEPKLICAYCLKHIKLPAYSLKLDLDLPKIYFCNEIEAELWLTQAIAKTD